MHHYRKALGPYGRQTGINENLYAPMSVQQLPMAAPIPPGLTLMRPDTSGLMSATKYPNIYELEKKIKSS